MITTVKFVSETAVELADDQPSREKNLPKNCTNHSADFLHFLVFVNIINNLNIYQLINIFPDSDRKHPDLPLKWLSFFAKFELRMCLFILVRPAGSRQLPPHSIALRSASD